jgi:hypothetical protein
MDRAELERLDRESLVMRAQAAGIRRARVLTRPELIDELLRLDPAIDPSLLKKNRGFFGVARDLLSRVVERGLHLPDAADRLRAALGNPLPHIPRPEPQAVPTVTLAEIYAAQGHKGRAVETLWRVLEAEPDHAAARALLTKLQATDYIPPTLPLPPENDEAGAGVGVEAEPEVAQESMQERVERAAFESTFTEAPTIEMSIVEDRFVAAPTIDASVIDEVSPASPLAASAPPPGDEALTTPRMEEPTTLPLPLVPSECVAIPLEDGRFYVWWRLGTDARQRVEDAFFFVRAVVFVPTWDGPQQEIRDVACDPSNGELVLDGLPGGSVVRIAVGVMEGGDVVPLAHSPALETSTSRGLLRWTLEGAVPIELEDPEAASIARAAEGAARSGLPYPAHSEPPHSGPPHSGSR